MRIRITKNLLSVHIASYIKGASYKMSNLNSFLELVGEEWNEPLMEEQDPATCFKRSLASC